MSAFRFVRGDRAGSYSVHRGEQFVGHVTHEVLRVQERGVTHARTRWRPSTLDPAIHLALAPTREAAARALWKRLQDAGRR